MSISANSGGLITRGLGEDHRLITRGMGMRFEFGGVTRKLKEVFFSIDLLAPIIKEDSREIDMWCPIARSNINSIGVSTDIQKNVSEEVGVGVEVNSDPLFDVLDKL